MAVASAHRIARDDNRDSAAEALPFEGLFILAHEFSLRSSARRVSIERLQRSGGYVGPPPKDETRAVAVAQYLSRSGRVSQKLQFADERRDLDLRALVDDLYGDLLVLKEED